MTPVRAHRFGCDLLIPIPCLPDALFDALVQLVDDGVTHRESDVLDSWLFVRDDESVRIVRRGDFELNVRLFDNKRTEMPVWVRTNSIELG